MKLDLDGLDGVLAGPAPAPPPAPAPAPAPAPGASRGWIAALAVTALVVVGGVAWVAARTVPAPAAAPPLPVPLAALAAAPVPPAPSPPPWQVVFAYGEAVPGDTTVPRALLACARIDIVGSTDASGPADHNLRVGQDRADALAALLVAAGYSAERITARSVGEQGADPDADEAERRATRRAVATCTGGSP